jgi:hypothetical protein
VTRALTSRRAPRIRTGVAAFLVAASVLAVLVSALALWSHDLVFDTDTYVGVAAPVIDDPEAREALGEYVAATAVRAVDLNARIEDALPSDAGVLAPALTSTLQSFLAGEIERFLATEPARRLWADANRLAHRQFITTLQAEGGAATVDEDGVRLDLLPLVAVALQKLEAHVPEILGRDVALPEIEPDRSPGAIRTLLQDALGRELPADLGSVTLLKEAQAREAKQALALFNDLVILVVALTVALVVAALLVSPRRLRTAFWLGFGSLLALVVARVITVRLEQAVVDAVPAQGGAAVARSVLGAAVRSLDAFLVWIAVAGAIVAVAALLAGRPTWLQAVGRGVAELFGVASDLSTPDTRSGRWMAAHLDLLRSLGVAVAVVVLLFVTSSPTAVIVVVLVLIAYELALAAYALGVPRELEEDAGGDPPARTG